MRPSDVCACRGVARQLAGRPRKVRGRPEGVAKLGRSPSRRSGDLPGLSRPAGGDLGGRPRDRPCLGAAAPCRAMNRRDADLCAGRRLSWAAPARGATDLPAMRVLGAGGGGRLPRSGRRRCRRGVFDEALRRCLTQRGERQRRVHGVTHQGSERALLRAAGFGQRGEHVFVKLRPGSDGTRSFRPPRTPFAARFGSASRLENTCSATDLARGLPGRPGAAVGVP